MNRFALAIAIALVALMAAGCAHKAQSVLKEVGPATLPAGWTLASNDAYGVSIGIAPGWKYGVDSAFDSNPLTGLVPDTAKAGTPPPVDAQFQKLADDVKKQDEQEQKDELKALEDKGIIVNVIDLGSRPTPGEARTCYYVHLKKDNGPSLEDAAADLRPNLLGDVTRAKVTLPVGDAILFKAHWKTQGGDEVYSINYVMVDGDNVYRIRFVQTGNTGAIDPISDQVAQTFRVTHKSK